MSAVHSSRVLVTSLAEYEQMLRHPGSVEGEFDHAAGTGLVKFATYHAALAARQEMTT